MKIKYLMIVGLILAIMTIGAASASDDVLAAGNMTEDSLEEVPACEIIEESDDTEPALALESEDFNASIKDTIDLEDENDQTIIAYDVPQGANGKVNVYVDYMDEPSYSKETVVGEAVRITTGDLSIAHDGEYHIMVDYLPIGGDAMTLAQHTLKAHIYTDSDFDIEYDIWSGSKNDNVVSSFYYPVTGTLTLFINGNPRCTRDFDELYEPVYVYLSDLNITADGQYEISAIYKIKATSKEIALANGTLSVYGVDWDADEYVMIYSSADILDHEDWLIEIVNKGKTVNGTVSVYIDGTLKLTKSVSSDDEIRFYDITVDELGLYNNITLGNHTVKVIYMKDDTESHEVEESVNFYAEPVFIKQFIVSEGEKDVLKVTYIKGFIGTATLYNTEYEQSEFDSEYYHLVKGSVYKSAEFTNGVAEITFNTMDEGDHVFILNITGYNLENYVDVTVKKNHPGYSASVLPSEVTVGNGVVVKFSGPQSEDFVTIILNDEVYKIDSLDNGTINETITGLAVGTHRIKVFYDDGSNFYSNTFYVTVKQAPAPAPAHAPAKKADKITLSLKKVKVKKSAKKLVLQATLKQGNKALSGKKITFKFNGKKYTAKTNKKGIAKVTIKKKVLKKLKVGKKVKYQVSYGKVTVTKTVKVKK